MGCDRMGWAELDEWIEAGMTAVPTARSLLLWLLAFGVLRVSEIFGGVYQGKMRPPEDTA